MQKPPESRRPQILLTRPTYEWITRVSRKHEQLKNLRLSSEQKAKLDRWVEIEFARSTLSLYGLNVSHEQVSLIASQPSQDLSRASDQERSIAETIGAFRIIAGLAQSEGRGAALTPEFLLKLGDPYGHGGRFRNSSGGAAGNLKPVSAQYLPAAIETACLWFSAESFAELNPVEQAAIVHLRLVGIQPFEQENERVALAAASLFTLRSDLPPVTVTPERAPRYRAARDEGLRMNTTPMVELMAELIEATLDEMIGLIRGK